MIMENDRLAGGSLRQNVVALVMFAIGIVRSIAQPDIVQFVLRIALAVPFWKSGILKWSGFLHLSDTAVTLFTDEFMIHVFGLATRFAALGLLFMTVIVELTVPDGWPIHITWAAMALAIMAWGPGRVSLDHAIRRGLES
jgi:putative oxidoreductase